MVSKILGQKVILVESNNHLLKILKNCLSNHNIRITRFHNIEAIPPTLNNRYSLLILDTDLKKASSIAIIEKIRKHNPFLFMIALGPEDKEFQIIACQLGINFYHSKPLNCDLLKAQMTQSLSALYQKIIIKLGDMKIDIASQSFAIHEKDIIFTYQEFHLLLLLIRSDGQILSRDSINRYFAGKHKDLSYAAIDTLVSRIRSKLRPHLNQPFIKTEYKLGYRINPVYLKHYYIEKSVT